MKKIVLAALLASVVITPAKADQAADFCAAVFTHAATFVEPVDAVASQKFVGMLQLMVRYHGAREAGTIQQFKNIAEGLGSGRKTMADLNEAVGICLGEYAK